MRLFSRRDLVISFGAMQIPTFLLAAALYPLTVLRIIDLTIYGLILALMFAGVCYFWRNPAGLLFSPHQLHDAPDEISAHIRGLIRHHTRVVGHTIIVAQVKDASVNMFLVVGSHAEFVITSSALRNATPAQIEAMLLYFISRMQEKNIHTLTAVTLLARVLHFAPFVGMFLASSILHAVSYPGYDTKRDEMAVRKTRFALGYRKSLELAGLHEVNGKLNTVLSSLAFVDIHSRSKILNSLFHMHKSSQDRIEGIHHVAQQIS